MNSLGSKEYLTLSIHGENSEFIRINNAKIRQIAELIEEDKKIMSSQYVLGDRIETVHQEILSLIDQIASEFKRFNTQQEGQRRRQIQTLSQDLRESTFHNLHPPSES